MKPCALGWLIFIVAPGCAMMPAGLTGVSPINGSQIESMAAGAAGTELVQAMRPFGWEEERAIGGAVAVQAVAQHGGLYPDGRVQRYVLTVGLAVASLSDRPEIPYHFAVLNDETPNAFAAPGGYVFITVGLLRRVHSEAELAGVLGHEIAHVTNKHALKVIRRADAISKLTEVSADFLDQNPQVFDDLVQKATDTVLNKGFDQTKESEADRDGIEFAHRIGYDLHGLPSFLETLAATEQPSGGIFSTHPPTRKRIDALNARIHEKYSGAHGVKLAKRFTVRTATLRVRPRRAATP